MRLGLYVRNIGPQSAPDTVVRCARAVEEPAPRVVAVTQLDFSDPPAPTARARAFAAAGATDLVHGWRYSGYDDFRVAADAMAALDLAR